MLIEQEVKMANANISTIGRFSSQMLTYLGTQKTVRTVTGTPSNTFKYSFGPTVFPNPGSMRQSDLGGGVSGAWSPVYFDSIKAFFLSRGATQVYADTMAAMTLDIAAVLQVTPQSLIEKSEFVGQLRLDPNAYRVFNELRDPGHQLGTATSVKNRNSLQAREIRA
jgi:hypothetical protein